MEVFPRLPPSTSRVSASARSAQRCNFFMTLTDTIQLPMNFAELDRRELELALAAPRRGAFPRPPDLPLDPSPGRHRFRADDRSRPRPSRHAGERRRRRPHRPGVAPDVDRRHDQVPAGPRRRQADRSGLYSGHAGADVLRLDAGRMRDELRVLPDRQDGARAASHGRRNRRAGARARARDGPGRRARSTSC